MIAALMRVALIRVALYIRVSSEEQARHGLSLQEQRDALIRYAKANKMTVVGIYEDAGISARKPYKKRPALLRLLGDCKDGKIDMILFVKLDRWFRNVAGYYDVQTQLDQYGVTWQATEEDYETRTASGRLKVNIMLSVAQDEADRTSERIKFINDGKRAKGQPAGSKAPLGYAIKDRQYQIDNGTADAARDMFAAFIRLKSVLAVKRYMLDTWGIDRAYSKYVNYFRNRLYIGEVYGIENACPALVSKQDFDIVNDIICQRSQRCAGVDTDRVYLFSGILHCKECGKTMQSETVKKTYTYYRCRTRMLDNTSCPHTKRIREDVLEDYLLHELAGIAERNNRYYKKAEKKPTQSADSIRKKMSKLKTLYLNDLIELDDYKAEYSILKRSLETVEEKPKTDLDALRNGLGEYGTYSREEKKEFWTRFIKRIDADNDGAFFVTPR